MVDKEKMESEPQHVSSSHESFIRNFIKTYRENRILWDKKHPKYKCRDDRDAAFDALISASREYFPEANLDFVKTKIDSIRGVFRREHKKVQDSKKRAKSDEDIYVPSLWYYSLLLFIIGEEIDELNPNKESAKHIHYSWSKHHTVLLIELLKKYPILYSLEPLAKGPKQKRNRAYRDIANELIIESGTNFKVHEVKNKINTLKQQFRRECRNRGHKQIKNSPKLWCYDLLMFLKDSVSNPKKQEHTSEDEQDTSDQDTENSWIAYETESDSDKKAQIHQVENQDDIFDTIGKNVAMKLRDMADDQRMYAENLINELMYHGLMGNLTVNSRIIFTGD